jgi:hypothetical protein
MYKKMHQGRSFHCGYPKNKKVILLESEEADVTLIVERSMIHENQRHPNKYYPPLVHKY